VAHRAGLIRKDGHIPRLSRVFAADSTATLAQTFADYAPVPRCSRSRA
jgi:hypothetical protein